MEIIREKRQYIKKNNIYSCTTCTIESKSQKLLKLKWLRLQLENWNLWHHLQVVTETNEKNLPSAQNPDPELILTILYIKYSRCIYSNGM